MAKRTGILKEMRLFIMNNKAYWLAPVILVLLVLTALMLIGTIGGGAAAPFIYPLF